MTGVSTIHGQVYTINAFYVSPPRIIDTTKTAGTTFTAEINVKDITDLLGYNFRLNYTATVLTATEVTLGSFFPSDAWKVKKEINDVQGYVWYAVLMPFGSQVGKSGSGTLATISFTVDSLGESPLDLDTLEIFDSQMVGITHNVYDGYFSNIPRPWIYADPPRVVPPQHLIPSENFTINVNVFKVTDLHSFEFRLAYNTTLLDVLEIAEGSFMTGFGDTGFISNINETLGFVEAIITLIDPTGAATTPGNETLARVTFNIAEIGETDLDLYDTKLTDPASTVIKHYAFDGYFSNKAVIHDVAITDITTTITTVEVKDNMTFSVPKQVSEIYVGDKSNVTVHVKNNGTLNESFNVTAYCDDNIIDTKKIPNLSAGFSIILPFEWNTDGVPTGNYTIWAETSVVEGDINPDNNKLIMEDEFRVLWRQTFPWELAAAAGGIVLIIAATAVYFVKIRKSRPGRARVVSRILSLT